jgi:hypothetical protein
MNQINDEKDYHLLYRSGFMMSEINRLIQLRRDYTASKLDEAPPPNHARLQFVWWFVRTIMTHDIGYVLSHRPKASGNASHHLVGKE